MATYYLPTGTKVRTDSKRRFVVVVDLGGRATVVKRSDNIDTAQSAAAGRPNAYVVDTLGETGKVLDPATRKWVPATREAAAEARPAVERPMPRWVVFHPRSRDAQVFPTVAEAEAYRAERAGADEYVVAPIGERIMSLKIPD